MSSYSKLIFFMILIFTSIGCAKQYETVKKPPINNEIDINILLALDSERNLDFNSSLKYYKKLYNLTHTLNYLIKTIEYSYKSKEFELMSKLSKEAMKNYPDKKEYFLKQYIISLLGQKKLDIALSEASILLDEYNTSQNYEIMANVYYAKGDYKNSLKYYESAYAQNQNKHTLDRLTTILYSYLNQKDVALAYLETYLQTKECNALICNKLMLIYQEQGNIDGMLSILNKMYIRYNADPSQKGAALIIQNIIISLLEKKDIKKAIKFLEKNKIDQVKLINLYYQNRQLKKALKLTRKMYKKVKSPQLLGKIAMYEFELAKDKRKVMKHVIANFELAFSQGVADATFQNYYGYLLIDFDINVKKGVKLVESALKTTPNNIAYLDSLAWGYYKLGLCKKAKKIMLKVIQTTGLNDNEIKTHWNKIQKCNKTNK